jgi:S-adenosyl-L-methionine hydrolase (adenosine-forming)
VHTITLLTDFGTSDYYVAAMKGVILSRNPAVRIVDISHEIAPQHVPSAAYVLLGAYDNFPAGTIHVVVVDPGVGSRRRPMAVKAGRHLFVAPDNGVLSFALKRVTDYEAVEITNQDLLPANISTTFHGRDVFAPIAAALSLGVPLHQIGKRISDLQLLPEPVQVSGSLIESRIIHIDHFGNCITGIERTTLPGGELSSKFALQAGSHEIRRLKHFYLEEVDDPDYPFVIWGSIGFLEISLIASSAAERLGLKLGDSVRLHYAAIAER